MDAMDHRDKKIEQLKELVKMLNDALLEANKTLKDNNLPEVKKSIEHLFEKEAEVLTKEQFDAFPEGMVFATGVLPNSPEGIFMTRNGGELRWVAKKGWGYDWAIYCHWSDRDADWVRDHGDKVTNEKHIRLCVPCTDEVFQIYRY